jgi:tRNA-Thr(GGU) m(6)t(6)A37 methyltransferase TsaA
MRHSARGDFCTGVAHAIAARLNPKRSTSDDVSAAAAASGPVHAIDTSPATVHGWAEQLARTARTLLASDSDYSSRVEVTALNGFVNVAIDQAWVASQRPTAAQKQLSAPPPPPSFHFTAIGHVESCFPEKHGCPRQGAKAPTTRGRLVLRPDLPVHVVDGLEGFSHVWLIFVFHGNDEQPLTRTKLRPPRLLGEKIGMFASRTPHRINPIGLTVCKLDKVVGGTLHLSGIDLIDGTPIIDVKPYHSADVVALPTDLTAAPPLKSAPAMPTAAAAASVASTNYESDVLRLPAWVAGQAQMPSLKVTFRYGLLV